MEPTWDDLRHLESLDRLGSASAASRELGVAPSTIYRRIAALEEAVGAVCYSQREGGVTALGRELAELARSTRSSISRIVHDAHAAQERIRGRLTLTTLDGFSPLLIDPLATLAELHPELEIVLDISPRGSSIRKGEADIALTSVDRPPWQLVGRKVFTASSSVYATPELARDWRHAPWIVLGPPLGTSPIARWERARAKRSRIAVATASRLTLNRLVSAGVGIGVIPHVLIHDHPEVVEVTMPRDTPPIPRLPVWLLTHPELRSTAAVGEVMRVVSDALTEHAKRQPKTRGRSKTRKR